MTEGQKARVTTILAVIISSSISIAGTVVVDRFRLLASIIGQPVLLLSVIFLLVSVGVLSWLVISLKRRLNTKLIPKLGMLWDKDLNPYCPKDNVLVSYSAPHKDLNDVMTSPAFYCPSCKLQHYAKSDDGTALTLEDARLALKGDISSQTREK